MLISEFIDKHYPSVVEYIEMLTADPYRIVMEKDDLPYDDIKVVDGMLQKVVYITDDEFVPIIDLLCVPAEDVADMPDGDYKTLYNTYMENVVVEVVDLENIRCMVQKVRENQSRKESLLGVQASEK